MLPPMSRPGCHHCNEQPSDVPCWWCGRKNKTAKNPHAVALGKKGGRVTSEAKAAASRLNGAKGGRPIKPKPG